MATWEENGAREKTKLFEHLFENLTKLQKSWIIFADWSFQNTNVTSTVDPGNWINRQLNGCIRKFSFQA